MAACSRRPQSLPHPHRSRRSRCSSGRSPRSCHTRYSPSRRDTSRRHSTQHSVRCSQPSPRSCSRLCHTLRCRSSRLGPACSHTPPAYCPHHRSRRFPCTRCTPPPRSHRHALRFPAGRLPHHSSHCRRRHWNRYRSPGRCGRSRNCLPDRHNVHRPGTPVPAARRPHPPGSHRRCRCRWPDHRSSTPRTPDHRHMVHSRPRCRRYW